MGTVSSRRAGAGQPTSFIASGKFAATTNVRLLVSTTADLATAPVFFGPVAIGANGYAKIQATGLASGTTYYYGWETDGAMAAFPAGKTYHGRCKTLPLSGGFKILASSCQTSSSVSSIFTQFKTEDPLMFLHMGDYNYSDTNVSTESSYRTQHETQIAQALQQDFEEEVARAYVFNDHDFCGNNSSRDWVGNGTIANAGRAAVQAVYREVFPHYSLPATTGAIWHTFDIGRFHFFLMDTRSESSHKGATNDSAKTKLGAEQKTAFKNWLSANPTEPKIVLTCEAFHNATTNTGDGWNQYSTERTELTNYITANGIVNGVWLGGDEHAVAYATSANGTPAGWPTIQAAPIDQSPSLKAGPYAERSPDPIVDAVTKIGQYAVLTATDAGGTTASLGVGFRDSSGATLLAPDETINFTGLASLDAIPPAAPTGLTVVKSVA